MTFRCVDVLNCHISLLYFDFHLRSRNIIHSSTITGLTALTVILCIDGAGYRHLLAARLSFVRITQEGIDTFRRGSLLITLVSPLIFKVS